MNGVPPSDRIPGRPRAVVFDVYGTLLRVVPLRDRPESEARWRALCRRRLGREAGLDWSGLLAAVERRVRADHAAARACGIPWPEVDWAGILTGALPELSRLEPGERDAFLVDQASLWHQVDLMPGAARVLLRLAGEGVCLGIASNAQPYTLAELERALAGTGFDLSRFEPSLRFWSFDHGFSKPDPHVFRILGARLAARGISGDGILMVGDRADNDIAPARRAGWRTWQWAGTPTEAPGGDWAAFEAWWEAGCPGTADPVHPPPPPPA